MSDWTSSDLSALNAAIASGIQTVKYADKTITYHSVDQMIKARDLMKREINQVSADESQTSYAQFERD